MFTVSFCCYRTKTTMSNIKLVQSGYQNANENHNLLDVLSSNDDHLMSNRYTYYEKHVKHCFNLETLLYESLIAES